MLSFPNLMRGKRILYVHGFASSAQSGTVHRLRATFPEADVVAFDLPVDPNAALDLLRGKCDELHPDLILGTSMGGMFAEQLHGYDRILVNPAFQIADTMREHNMMGKQTFLNPRADGVQEFYVDKPLVKAYRDVSEQCFSGINDDKNLVVGLFGDNDPLVHTYDLFLQHYPCAIRFHGEHRMDDHSFMHAVVPVIRWIDDRQERRQRPIVFISVDAMCDAYDKPVSSVQKAVMTLIETYNVYFLAPCPSTDHAHAEGILSWLERYVDVPAYDHVVFTNQPQLLYGDYFVMKDVDASSLQPSLFAARPADADMMGAVIAYGSDEFKTWEDILVYFERLGGQ